MLDDKDMQKLLDVFVSRAQFQDAVSQLATKDDLHALRSDLDEKMNDLLTTIDACAVKADAYMQETVML